MKQSNEATVGSGPSKHPAAGLQEREVAKQPALLEWASLGSPEGFLMAVGSRLKQQIRTSYRFVNLALLVLSSLRLFHAHGYTHNSDEMTSYSNSLFSAAQYKYV